MKNEQLEKFVSSFNTDNKKWVEAANERKANKKWLKKSQMIAIRILSELNSKGMQQKELAEIMGVSPQQVNKFVKGKENLTLDTISKLEDALQINLISVHYKCNVQSYPPSGLDNIKPTFNGPKLQLLSIVKNESTSPVEPQTNPSYKKVI